MPEKLGFLGVGERPRLRSLTVGFPSLACLFGGSTGVLLGFALTLHIVLGLGQWGCLMDS